MVGRHHRLNGHQRGQTLGDGEGQRSLVCCSPWGCKESDTTEQRRRVLAAGHLQLLLSLLNPVGHRPTPSRQDLLAGPRPFSPGTSPREAPCFWNLHTCFPWSAGGCFFPPQLPEASRHLQRAILNPIPRHLN